jgi:RimJ/RimL family protein N-acetyltransferase
MKIIEKGKLEVYSLPLPMYKSVVIADAIGRDGSEFELVAGLDKKYVEQLRNLSADESDTMLQNFTGDMKRFVTGTYEYWYQKNRSIFALIHKQTGDLAAVIWFGPKPLGKKSAKFGTKDDNRAVTSEWHTISFRSYPNYRGRGLMKNFSRFVMDIYKRYFPHAKFWCGMDDRNGPMRKLMEDLGFQVSEEHSDMPEHWLIMTRV